MQPTREKIVDINKYRQRGREHEPLPPPRSVVEPAVKEIAYHLLMALQCAKRLL